MRVIVDMESGERDTYGDDAVQAAEDAYQLEPGTLRRALAGEIPEPEPLYDSPMEGTLRTLIEEHVLDTAIGQVIYQIAPAPDADDSMSAEERQALEDDLAERLKTEIPLFVEMRRRELEQEKKRKRDDA
jgi:hypothetical protein